MGGDVFSYTARQEEVEGGHDAKDYRWACLLKRVYFIRGYIPVLASVTIKLNKKCDLHK